MESGILHLLGVNVEEPKYLILWDTDPHNEDNLLDFKEVVNTIKANIDSLFLYKLHDTVESKLVFKETVKKFLRSFAIICVDQIDLLDGTNFFSEKDTEEVLAITLESREQHRLQVEAVEYQYYLKLKEKYERT